MPFDTSTLPAKTRAKYVHLGRQFGSPDTLAQANQTLKGLGDYGPELMKHGFVAVDVARLEGARDGLITAGVGRADAVGAKKVTSAGFGTALGDGKETRHSALSILGNIARALHDVAGGESGIHVINAALKQTSTAGDDAEALATQLDTLRGALGHADVAPEAALRGGPEVVVELQAGAAALRAAAVEHAGGRGTPGETEELDVLDGIIVTLARGARKAARAAAKRLGKPALVADFELTKLYAVRKGKVVVVTGGGGVVGGGTP